MIGKTDPGEWQQGVIVELMILTQLVQVMKNKIFKNDKDNNSKTISPRNILEWNITLPDRRKKIQINNATHHNHG